MKTTLRFLAFIMLGIMPLFLWNCSDDKDDSPEGSMGLIVGTWEEVDYPECTITFKSNGTYIDDDGSIKTKGTFKIEGDEIIVKYYDDEDGEYVDWVLTIIELTPSSLTIRDEYGYKYSYRKR